MNPAAHDPGLRSHPSENERRGPLFQAVRRFLRSQFGQPAGVFGRLAGRIMAAAPSNNDRIRWTLGLLEIKHAKPASIVYALRTKVGAP